MPSHDSGLFSSSQVSQNISVHSFKRESVRHRESPSKRISLHLPSDRSLLSTPSNVNATNHLAHSTAGPPELDPDDVDDYIENDWKDQIVMAVDVTNRHEIGCCYYLAKEQKLLLMTEIFDGGLEILDSLKVYVQPTVVIMSLRLNESAEAFFRPQRGVEQGEPTNDDSMGLAYDVQYRPPSEFSYDFGKRKLLCLEIHGHSSDSAYFVTPGRTEAFDNQQESTAIDFIESQGKLLKLSAAIDMDSRLTVGCAGAVLAFIGRNRAMDILPGTVGRTASFEVKQIEMFSIQDMMFVNADTLASLQILHPEASPNAHSQGPSKGASGSKEGLSVYGLFHHLARTPQGKRLLRQFFLRPTLNMEVINERLESIAIFSRSDNDASVGIIVKNLIAIKDIRTVLVQLRKGIGDGMNKASIRSGIWSVLRLFAFHSLRIRDTLMEVAGIERRQIGQRVFEYLNGPDLAYVGRRIGEVIDFRTSSEMYRTVVNPGVDEDLDRMKRNYNGMEDMLNLFSHEVAATIPRQYDLSLNVIFFPQIGFLISILLDPETGLANYDGSTQEGLRWEHKFSTSARAYYKDARMRDLDETWGDVYGHICDKEIEIIHALSQDVLQFQDMLVRASDTCGELDSILALAQGVGRYHLTRPRMTKENIIEITGGRHILQESTVSSFVPNETFLVGGYGCRRSASNDEGAEDTSAGHASSSLNPEMNGGPSMLVMTGPNYSGKSVYLKQVAIIVYMAHVGSFVPADQATIGLTDKILTRIATRETVSHFQSTFMTDLQQINLAIALATRRSLLVIDEFGKGTDSKDGAGLACGVLEHFLGLGKARPKVLAATHFHEIFENGFLAARPHLAFGFMEVRLEEDAHKVEDQITYLYVLRSGRRNSSFGNHCAAINGIEAAIVTRSEELEALWAKGEDLVAACSTITEKEEKDLKMAEAVARDFLAQDLRSFIRRGNEEVLEPHPKNLFDQVL